MFSQPDPLVAGRFINTQLSVQSYADIIMSVAGNFDGLMPEGNLTTSSNQYTFAVATHAGLIDPVILGLSTPLRILRLELYMAGQTTFTVNLLDGTNTMPLASGTTAASFLQEKLTYLTQNQKLQVLTTGGGTTSVKMICTVCNPNFGVFGV